MDHPTVRNTAKGSPELALLVFAMLAVLAHLWF